MNYNQNNDLYTLLSISNKLDIRNVIYHKEIMFFIKIISHLVDNILVDVNKNINNNSKYNLNSLWFLTTDYLLLFIHDIF